MAVASGQGFLFMRTGTIKSAQHLLAAARHNKRETIEDHIDGKRLHLNYPLTPQASALEVTRRARSLLSVAGLGNGRGLKPLRRNAVYAVEYLFSLPARFSGDYRAFFEDCLNWLTRHVCAPENVLSADVHLDEGAPHMHVLILPLVGGKMQGSEVRGRKPVMRQRHASFFEEVGTRYGLKRRTPGAGKRHREATRLVLDHFSRNHSQLLEDPTWPVIREAIKRNPDDFLCPLGLSQSPSPQPMRTMAEIFTSPGKGAQRERLEVGRCRPNPESLCSVDFYAGIEPLAHEQQRVVSLMRSHSSGDGVVAETSLHAPMSPACQKLLETGDSMCIAESMVLHQAPVQASINEATWIVRKRQRHQARSPIAEVSACLSRHSSMTVCAPARAPPPRTESLTRCERKVLGRTTGVGRYGFERPSSKAQKCQWISRKKLEMAMGGSGSGRRPDSVRQKASAADMLDVRQFKRQGFFQPGQSMHWTSRLGDGTMFHIHVLFAHTKLLLAHRRKPESDWREVQSYEVAVEWVPCHLGGQRPWFRCPIPACSRRVACLYLAPSGVYTCRHCQRLVYETQYESPSWRLMTRGDKIRCRLGWGPGILNPTGGKPKYMHWNTYERLRHREARVVDIFSKLILPR